MNICIPIDQDLGLKSVVCGHFGSAAMFLIVDPNSGDCHTVTNHTTQHRHGACQPLAALKGEAIAGVVVAGIGKGAATKLRKAGVEVYLASHKTVEEMVDAFKAGALKPAELGQLCGGRAHGNGNGNGHGCGHAHGRGHGGC